jgi:hypothetical protein
MMKQGNRQGALPSPSDYITLLSNCLDIVETSTLGFHIGDILFSSPTCADDMLLLARSPIELQTLLYLIVTYANEEHYVIHPDKSVVLALNTKSKEQLQHFMESKPWCINERSLPVVTEVTHVGVQRDLSGIDATVSSRISCGRQALFSLLGSGMYGSNGLPVRTSIHMYQIYSLPRVTHGLEALVLSKTGYKSLETFQRTVLRSILGVPKRTAIPALYLITGVLPTEFLLDQRQLIFLHSLIKEEGRLKDLVVRQCVMKKENSKSWVPHMKNILRKYSLPCIPDLLEQLPSKTAWKRLVKSAIIEEAEKELEFEAKMKSSIKYLNPIFKFNKCHNVVNHIRNPREVTRATVKTQMITGTYMLQTSRYKYNQTDSDTCLLCRGGPDDLKHALLQCQATADVRRRYMPAIHNSIPYVYQSRNAILSKEQLLTQFIMDYTHPSITELVELPEPLHSTTEQITRDYCFAVHISRSQMLAS